MRGVADARSARHIDRRPGRRATDGRADDGAGSAGDAQRAADAHLRVGRGRIGQVRSDTHVHVIAHGAQRIATAHEQRAATVCHRGRPRVGAGGVETQGAAADRHRPGEGVRVAQNQPTSVGLGDAHAAARDNSRDVHFHGGAGAVHDVKGALQRVVEVQGAERQIAADGRGVGVVLVDVAHIAAEGQGIRPRDHGRIGVARRVEEVGVVVDASHRQRADGEVEPIQVKGGGRRPKIVADDQVRIGWNRACQGGLEGAAHDHGHAVVVVRRVAQEQGAGTGLDEAAAIVAARAAERAGEGHVADGVHAVGREAEIDGCRKREQTAAETRAKRAAAGEDDIIDDRAGRGVGSEAAAVEIDPARADGAASDSSHRTGRIGSELDRAVADDGVAGVEILATEDEVSAADFLEGIGRAAVADHAAQGEEGGVIDSDGADDAGGRAERDGTGAEGHAEIAAAAVGEAAVEREVVGERGKLHVLVVERAAGTNHGARTEPGRAVDEQGASVEHHAAGEGVGRAAQVKVLVAGLDQRQRSGVVHDRRVDDDAALIAGGDVKVVRGRAVLPDHAAGTVDAPVAVGVIEETVGFEVKGAEIQRVVAALVAQGHHRAVTGQGRVAAAAAELDAAGGVGAGRIAPCGFRRGRDVRWQDVARAVINCVIPLIPVVVARRRPRADDHPARQVLPSPRPDRRRHLDEVGRRVRLRGLRGEGHHRGVRGPSMGQAAEGQRLGVASLVLVGVQDDVRLAAAQRHGADGLGIGDPETGRIIELEVATVARDASTVAHTVDAGLVIGVGQDEGGTIGDHDTTGLADRAEVAIEVKRAAEDVRRAGIGVETRERHLAVVDLGQRAVLDDRSNVQVRVTLGAVIDIESGRAIQVQIVDRNNGLPRLGVVGIGDAVGHGGGAARQGQGAGPDAGVGHGRELAVDRPAQVQAAEGLIEAIEVEAGIRVERRHRHRAAGGDGAGGTQFQRALVDRGRARVGVARVVEQERAAAHFGEAGGGGAVGDDATDGQRVAVGANGPGIARPGGAQ